MARKKPPATSAKLGRGSSWCATRRASHDRAPTRWLTIVTGVLLPARRALTARRVGTVRKHAGRIEAATGGGTGALLGSMSFQRLGMSVQRLFSGFSRPRSSDAVTHVTHFPS
jgi:hypothetical protein